MKKVMVFLSGEPLASGGIELIVPQTQGKCAVVCVADGGAEFVTEEALECCQELFFFGDNDSSSLNSRAALLSRCQKKGVPVVTLPKSTQNESDFAQILDFLNQRVSDFSHGLLVTIFCGLGRRRDHERVNLDEALIFTSQFPAPCVVTFEPSLVLANCTFELKNKGVFTLRAQSYPCEVSLTGALYSGRVVLTRPSHGLSNQTMESNLCLQFQDKTLILEFPENA